jgi:hypothetical protein
MSEISVRPRIRHEVAEEPDKVREMLIAHEQNHNQDLMFSKKHNHCTIEIHPSQQHYWSPYATFNLEKTENGTIVRGIVGPRPNLWASFMVLYVFSLASFTITAVIGTGMLSLNKSGLLLYISPVFLFLFVAIYFAAQIGKNKASNQTKQIKQFIKEALISNDLSPK